MKWALLPPLTPHDCGEADVVEHRGGVETISRVLTWRRKPIYTGQGKGKKNTCYTISLRTEKHCFLVTVTKVLPKTANIFIMLQLGGIKYVQCKLSHWVCTSMSVVKTWMSYAFLFFLYHSLRRTKHTNVSSISACHVFTYTCSWCILLSFIKTVSTS